MEVNCNGHASTPESEASLESQECGTKQSAEEVEDQQNANQPENNTETDDTLCNNEDTPNCNGSTGDPELHPQQQPASINPDSITVELKEEDNVEKKKEDGMDTQGENTGGGEDNEDSQNGLCNFILVSTFLRLTFHGTFFDILNSCVWFNVY